MASDSDYSDESVTSEGEMNLDEFGEEVHIVTGEPKPYQDEPLANESESEKLNLWRFSVIVIDRYM